jgi:uncharacterized protein (DUF305 family)
MLWACAGSCSATANPNAADRAFVHDAVPHHELGIELIALAETHSSDVRLRRMVFEQGTYHGPELDRLHTWAAEWEVAHGAADPFPGELTADTVEALRRMDGPAFDVAWLDAMIEHHRGFLQIAAAAEQGAVVATFATPLAVLQQAQIDQMVALRDELG